MNVKARRNSKSKILVATLACTLMISFGCGGVEGDESKDSEGQDALEKEGRLFEPENFIGQAPNKLLRENESCQQIDVALRKVSYHFNDAERNHRDEIQGSVGKAAFYIVKYASVGEVTRAEKIAISAIRNVKEAGLYYQAKIQDDLMFGWKFTHKECGNVNPVGVKNLKSQLEKMQKQVDSNIEELEASAIHKLEMLVK